MLVDRYLCIYPHHGFILGKIYYCRDLTNNNILNEDGDAIPVSSLTDCLHQVFSLLVPFSYDCSAVVCIKTGMGLSEGKSYAVKQHHQPMVQNDRGVLLPLKFLTTYVKELTGTEALAVTDAAAVISRYNANIEDSVLNVLNDLEPQDIVELERALAWVKHQREITAIEDANHRQSVAADIAARQQEILDNAKSMLSSNTPRSTLKKPAIDTRTQAQISSDWDLLTAGKLR